MLSMLYLNDFFAKRHFQNISHYSTIAHENENLQSRRYNLNSIPRHRYCNTCISYSHFSRSTYIKNTSTRTKTNSPPTNLKTATLSVSPSIITSTRYSWIVYGRHVPASNIKKKNCSAQGPVSFLMTVLSVARHVVVTNLFVIKDRSSA